MSLRIHPAVRPLLTGPTIALAVLGLAAGTAAVFLDPRVAAVAAAGAVAAILPLVHPAAALYVFLFGVVLLTDAYAGLEAGNFAIPDIDVIRGLPPALETYFLFMFAVVIGKAVLWDRKPIRVPVWPLAAYAAILAVSLAWGWKRGWELWLIRVDLVTLLLPVLCFYLCVLVLDSRRAIDRALAVVFAATALKAAVLGLYYLLGRGVPYGTPGEGLYRIVTYDSADLIACLAMVLLAGSLVLHRRVRAAPAVALLAACAPMVFALVFSFRRSHWVAAALAAGVFFLLAHPPVRRSLLVLAGLGALAAPVLLSAMIAFTSLEAETLTRIPGRFLSIFDADQASNEYHRLEAEQTLADLSGSPLFGLGLGSRHGIPRGFTQVEVPTNVVHNTFLYWYMKLGLAGLLFYLAALGSLAVRVLQRRRRLHDVGAWAVILPLTAALASWFMLFLVGPVPYYVHQMFLLAAFSAVLYRLARRPPGPRRAGRRALVP